MARQFEERFQALTERVSSVTPNQETPGDQAVSPTKHKTRSRAAHQPSIRPAAGQLISFLLSPRRPPPTPPNAQRHCHDLLLQNGTATCRLSMTSAPQTSPYCLPAGNNPLLPCPLPDPAAMRLSLDVRVLLSQVSSVYHHLQVTSSYVTVAVQLRLPAPTGEQLIAAAIALAIWKALISSASPVHQ